MKCKLCGQDLSPAIQLFSKHTVSAVHKSAHVDKAIRELLEAADQWPELEQHFEPLRKALAWRLEE